MTGGTLDAMVVLQVATGLLFVVALVTLAVDAALGRRTE